MNWITSDDTIIFEPKYNKELNIELISAYKKLIFSDFVSLNKILFDYYLNNVYGAIYYKQNMFNKDVSNLPFGLTHLIFGDSFNCDVSALPPTLTLIKFGHYFNQDISNLPQGITHLSLGGILFHDAGIFNQNYDIPPNIKYLTLNCNNQYVIEHLPNSIVELELGYGFNLEMNNLPTSIKKLVISKYSDYNIKLNCLPNFIEELHLNRHYPHPILNIPTNLKKLICMANYPYINDFKIFDVKTYIEDRELTYEKRFLTYSFV